MGKVYQVVTMNGSKFYSKKEFLDTYIQSGTQSWSWTREELQGEPTIHGFLGPMWNGYNEKGQAVIRYETQSYYNTMD